MSELDPPLKEAPDFLAYGDWETSNDSGNAITNRQNYAEYVRGEYAKTNSYSSRIENEIRQATYDAAIKDGVITPDADEVTINTLFAAPSKVTFDDKLRLIQNNLPQGDPAYTAARDYLIHKDLSRFGTAPEGAAEEYLQNAESVADEGYQRALKIAVNNNEILMAKIRDADGAERIISAPNLPELTPLQAIEAGRLGGLTFADIDAVSSELSTPIGLSEPLSRVKRYSGAAGAIEEIAKKDKSVAAAISRAADTLAKADKDGEPMTVREYDAGIIRFRLNNSGLLSEGDTFTEEEVAKAITQIALSTANANGRFKLYDDPEDMDKNVRVAGYMSPLVHPAAMINDDLFEQSVTNNNKLSDTQKTIITESREAHLQASFEDYNKTLTESSLSDEWLNTLQAGRASGKKDTDILREFTSNPENFSELKDRALGVGASIADGFGELVAALPMMMEADWARDYMVGNIKERNNRREVARMFKTEYGMGQDIMETITPMLVDMTATALLAALTAGTAGATYLMVKQGARLTAKGLVKAAVGSTFRQLPNETAKAAAERVLAQNLIRASTTEAGRTGAMKAISAYNNVVARRIGVSTAVALPAFNRSAGATYAAVYSTLQEKGELSPEEMHDRALGAGLTAGTITAAITSAFGVIGRGGLEEALLGGATRKQLKQVVTRLAGVDDISDDVFNRIVAQQLSESLKRLGSGAFGKEVLKNAFDEGVEEGLDEFINGFVVDAATDEDTPLLERLEQAARAAIIGGVIGGGVPVIRAAKDRIVSGSGAEQARAAEIQFARGVSEKLAASGSPITAQTVYTILTAPRRVRAPIAEAVLAQSRQRAAAAPAATPTPEAAPQTLSPLEQAEAERLAQLSPEERKIQSDLIIQRIRESLNNNTSPEAVAKILVDERGQGLFPFMEDIVPNEVVKRKRKARKPAGRKSPVIEQLEFDFESKRTNKLQGELVQGELDLGLDTSSETKPKVRRKRTTAITQTDKKTQLAEQLELDFTSVSTSARNNHVNPSDSDDELTPPTPKPKRPRAKKVKPTDTTEVADEPMFDLDEFIDDELIGQEVTAMTKLASLGYPVRLQRKALFGMPQRGKYPKDYLVGKSDLLARKVGELFPSWESPAQIKATEITGKDKVTFYEPKSKKVVRQRPKAYVDPDGVGIFNNDPVSMKVLLDRHIPVLVPANFTGQLNPAFRTFTSGGLTFINDIVTVNPESGSGFVSALTKQDRVLSSEPNYQYYNSLASFITLFNTGIAERSVPNPKGGEAEVTLDEIISNSDRLVSAASSGRGTITFGDSDKATATLRSLLKPFQGTLEQDFFEAAVPAFSMAVRKEAYLFELRLAMEKFAQTKDGETTPSLKPKSIQPAIAEFMARTKLEGPEAKVSVARSLANVFGSDIDPAKQPDLVIQDFLENHVLTRRKTMPTLREIGSKVGNAFADQQRSRNLIERKALFETTSPDDLAKIQDDAELFDPETEAEDDTFIPPTGDYPAPTTEMVSRVLEQAAFDVADALDSDPELRGAIDELLRGTVFSGNSSIDVTKFNSTDAFGMLASWMSSGNYKTNPAALQFQRDLRDGVYENAEPLRRTLKLMYLSSKTTDGNPAADAAFLESVRENLAASFGRTVTQREASDFIKSIGGAIQKLWSRSYVRGEQIIFARQENDAEVERLGLRTNDPQSVIDALKKIAATEPDANKKLLAKLLLENQAFIREVEFSLDESSLQYAGSYIRAANGQPMVSINLNGHNGRGLADVLLHEYLHAFVSVTVASPNENLTAAQRGALQRVNGILELARQSAAANGVTDPVLTDGLENVNEFIAHFFTSTEFQGYLKALVPPAKQRGFFGRLIDALLDMFGLNRSRQQSYQEAFTDIVDLTREAILRAPLTPKGLVNQIARPASGILNQAAGTAATIRRILASSVGTEAALTDADYARHAELEARRDSLTPEELREAEALVEKAARAAGYAMESYHGTDAPEFTEFNTERDIRDGKTADPNAFIGSHFAKSKSVAEKFASELYGAKDGRVMSLYLKLTNPLKIGRGDASIFLPELEKAFEEASAKREFERKTYEKSKPEPTPEELNARLDLFDKTGNIDDLLGPKYDIPESLKASEDKEKEAYQKLKYARENNRPVTEREILEFAGYDYDKVFAQWERRPRTTAMKVGRRVRDALEAVGYDGVIYSIAFESEAGWSRDRTAYIALYPSQIKSADPFTGVPLRQRFDTTSPDIRYTQTEAAAEAAAAQVTDTMVGGEAIAETTAQMTEKLKDVVRMVRRMVPMEFALEFTNDLPYAAALVGGTIQVNPARMASVIAGLDSTSANGVVEAIITEEAAHAASFNALTQVELDSFIGAMKPADFDSVADAYYQTPEAREAAKQRLRSEDEAVVRAERENLAEEKLRMHSQKVTRGFTTEEDVAFWRSKPSLLKILSRYLKGFMNRYAAGRSVRNMRGAQRVVLQRMIIEVRAINAGYRVMPNRLAFDVNNPVEALARIASQLNSVIERSPEIALAAQYRRATMIGVDPDFVKSQTIIGGEVGTRNPKNKEVKNTGFDPTMRVDLETMRENPEVYRKNAILLTTYPIVARELRLTGNEKLIDRIRALGNPVRAIEEQEAAQKERIAAIDLQIKTLVAQQKKVAASKLRGYDVRAAVEEAKKVLDAAKTEEDLKKLKGIPKLLSQKVKQQETLAKIRGRRKTAADKAKKSLNTIALNDKVFSMKDADAVYEALITATESNLSSLIEMFPPEVRKLAKLWYDGANLIAQRLAKAANVSVEQASGVLAVFSPQKDWFMNISLAERTMKFLTENQDAVFDDAMVNRYLMRAGEPQITGYTSDDQPIYQGKAIPEVDQDGRPVYDPVTGRQQFINWDTKSAEDNLLRAKLFLEQVRGKKFSELKSIQTAEMSSPMARTAVEARFIRMFSEVYDTPFFPVVTPDGRNGDASLSDSGKPISIAWGGYGTIEKAIRIMRAKGSTEEITKIVSNQLGEKHKVRSFYNNIVAPMSDRGDVTMDTHAIAALLWRALSGASMEVTQNFGGQGTASDGLRGLSGLYPAFAEAYRRAAANFDLLPREAQSITWEVVRMLFPAKWKSNRTNVSKVNKIWEQYENGEFDITEARERIFQLTPAAKGRTLAEAIAEAARDGDGVGRPVWFAVRDGGADTRDVSGADDQGTVPARGGLRDVPLIDGGFTRTVGGTSGVVSEPAGRRGRSGTPSKVRATQIGYEQRTPSIYERSLSTDADAGRRFSEGIRRTYAEHPMGKAVEVKPDEFYNDPTNRIFLDDDGLTGVAVTSYGDLVSVFKHPSSKTKITGLLAEASQYAVTLDAFDINGFLPNLYSRYGFRPAARVPFSREYAPEGWPYELAGEPDVILMVKDVNGVSGLPEIGAAGFDAVRDQIPVFADYDEAMAAQQAAKEKVAAALTPRVVPTQFGAESQLPAGFDADTIDYSAFIESLDMPVMEMGTYQSPTKMLDKLFRGELDPRIQKLKDQRDFFNKATFDLVRRYKTKMDAIIKRDFGSIEEAPVELIQAATGSTKGIVVPEDVMLQIEDDFDAAMETIDIDDTLSADDRVAAVELAFDNRAAAVAAAEKAVATEIRNRRDDALNELAKDSPELVAHIVQLRTLTDELSKKVTELYGFPPELKAKFDNQLGIYLTRTYRMFDEIGYADAVLNDPNYEDIRTAAIHFFENQFLKQEAQRRMTGSNPLPRAQAEAEAQMELERKSLDGRTYGQLMMEEFVRSYDKSGSAITSSGLSQSLKPMLNNIKMKRDLPKPIRDLLGEKGDEVGADNLLRSLITVGTMAANQSFLNHVRTVGHDSGWLLSAKEIAERRKTDYGTYGNYKPIRETASSAFDPLRNLYGPPELVDALHKTFSPDGMSFNQTTAQIAVEKTVGLAAKLSGAAMAAKTLGSIGFYIRNVASNALFFAPAQGFLNFKSMAGSAYSEIWSNAIVDPARVDSYRTKLISLGVIGDDINTNIMEAMLRGGVKTVDDIESKVDELINTAQKGAKPLAWLANRAQILSASVDAFYKISYYENELRVLRDARDVDTGRLANASDAELERMAAQKVLATAQSASQAPPLIREFTKSGVGLLFAPFIRFKAEVPRIVLNTYRTALTEMKSGNPVLYRRGIQRFSGMTIMLGGVSAILPAIASYLAGIGEDEDEALRAGLPEYLRNHTFFYFRRDNGQLQSWDFTFLNPFSLLADPVLRSMEHLLRGEPAEAAAKLVQTALFDQYLDDQILSAAIQNLRDNVNPTTARPIYEPQLDSAGTILFKSMFYVFKDAYQPSVMKRAIDSYRAVGADYTEFDDSPMGILMREFYPVKRHDIELDKSLRRYLFELRETYNRVGQRKNALLSQRAMEPEDVKELIQSEIEDKARINEDLYHKLRGFEGLGLTPQQLYQITTGAGVGKSRTRLLFNQLMDRPTLSPEMIQKLSDPENPQGAKRLKAAAEVLRATPRYILLEP